MASRIQPKKVRMHGRTFFRVRSKSLQLVGEPYQRYFGTRKEAKEFVDDLENRLEKFGESAREIPARLAFEATLCAQRLAGVGATLTDATEFFIQRKITPKKDRTFNKLREEFVASRKARGCKKRTVTEYESQSAILCSEFGKLDVRELCAADFEDWLEDFDTAPRTRLNYLKTANTMLRFALKRHYCEEVVTLAIDPPILEDGAIGILTPGEARKFLHAAISLNRDLVPALSIGLFGGIRRSEVFALTGPEVDMDEHVIEVASGKSKTRQRRVVTAHPTLAAWLAAFPPPAGRLVRYQHIDTFGSEIRKIASASGIGEWPHNALRHSFGTYFYAETKNETLTAAEMGNTPDVVIRHYRAVVKPSQAKAFWGITPPT